jgi:hypothetical protein
VRARDDLIERRDRAEHVAHVRERDELRAPQQRVEVVEDERAVVVDFDEAQFGAGLGGEQLPRHEVRVVLDLRGEDRVAGFEVLRPQLKLTRLIASVVLRVQMISSECAALTKRATLTRASSNASVARAAIS